MCSNINIILIRLFVSLSILLVSSLDLPGQVIANDETDLLNALEENHDSIVIQQSVAITKPLIIPHHVALVFEKSGNLQLIDSLIINGGISSGRRKIFTGDLSKLKGNPKIEACYPEWFGAVGDGHQNDQKQIQAAINFHSRVELKEKTDYLISGNIDLNDNSIIVGNDASFIFSNRGFVNVIDVNNVSITSLLLDFNNTNGFLRIENAAGVTVDRCEAINSNHSGLLAKNSRQLQLFNSDFSKNVKNGVYLYISSDFTLRNVRAAQNGQFGIYVSGEKDAGKATQFSENGKIEFCFAEQNGSILNGDVHMFSGITLLLARNVDVINCTSINNEEHGMVVQSGHDILIDGCISNENMISGLMIQDFLDDEKVHTIEISKNVTVSNSIMENNGKDILNHHQEVIQNGISVHGENENISIDRVHLKGNRFASIRTNSARKPTLGLTVKNIILDEWGKDLNRYKISGATKNVNFVRENE